MGLELSLRLGDTLDFKFTTATASGVPATLAGTPSVAAYVGNSLTEITAGLTLTVDFDGVVGLNHVRIVASSGNGFAIGQDYQIVITAGTVDGVSRVGYVVGEFSIEKRIAKAVWSEPTTAHVTPGTYGDKFGAHLKSVLKAIVGAGSSNTAVVLDTTTGIDGAAPSAIDDFYNGCVMVFTSGLLAGQRTVINDYVGLTKTLTVTALTGAPAAGDTAIIV